MGNFWHKLYSACDTPGVPTTEDQRYWTCPRCGLVWEWGVVNPGTEAVGWKVMKS